MGNVHFLDTTKMGKSMAQIAKVIIALTLLASSLGLGGCNNAENVTENTSQALHPSCPSENISAESGFEIPEGTVPQRAETYDDIILCGRFYNYRANCQLKPGPDYVKEAEITLSGCQFAPDVTYRDHIETKAGEIRYNIFYVALQDSSLRAEIGLKYARTGKQTLTYEIKLLETCPGIQVKKIREIPGYTGGVVGDKKICLMIGISPQVTPGDYTLCFIVDANGQNCGELPCVIHVTE
jgi:hypothetical protein